MLFIENLSDLKPENFLLMNEKDDSPLKVIDFGLSQVFGTSGLMGKDSKAISMTTRAGTVIYLFYCIMI